MNSDLVDPNSNDGASSSSIHGLAQVQITALPSHRIRNLTDENIVKVSGKRGTLFSGLHCNASVVAQAVEDLQINRPSEFCLGDSRASQLLVTHIDGWYAIPTPDAFSRHSG